MGKGAGKRDCGEKGPAVARGMSSVRLAGSNVRAVGKTRKTAVLIVGMRRSGSLAIGRMLNLCGCGLPNTSFATEAGEELASIITNLNDEILASAGSRWDDWQPFNPDWHDSPAAEEFHERAQAILAGEFGESRLFAIKDARICRLLPFWLNALRAFGAVVKIVCPIRNPLEVAASLHKSEGIDLATAQLVWLRHVLDVEAFSRGAKRSFVYYDELFGSSGFVAQRLGNELGISWPRLSTLADADGGPLLSSPHGPDGERSGFLDDPSLSSWIKSSFRILHGWTQGETRATDREELDRIRNAFNEAVPAFSRPVVLSQQMARRSIMLEERIARRDARIRELERATAQRDAELVDTRAREAAVAKQVAFTQARLSALENEIAGANAAVVAESKRTQVLTAEALSARKRLAAREHEITIKQEAIARARRHIGQLEAAAAARDRELSGRAATLDAALKARESENAELRQAIAERDIQITALDKTIVTLRMSNSWRITAPFRVASRMTRRLRSLLVNSILRTSQLWDAITTLQGRLRDWRAIRAIARSNLFDQDWYLKTYPDVAQCRMDPIRHYVAFGASEGRNPSAVFSTRGYFCSNRDVAAAGMNPLAHFVLHGPSAKEDNIRFPATKWSSKRRGVATVVPQVSIIIPVHNSGKYLSSCLTSLLAQSIERIEIICVDDGSNDDSFSILRAYHGRDSRIKIIRCRTNKGASHARNFGLQHATARYVQFMDSDDILPLGALNTLVGIAESDGVEVVRGSIACFADSKPQMLSLWNAAPNRRRFELSDEPRIWVPWGHQSYIFNREFLFRSGITYPHLRDGEDPIFIARVITSANRISSTAKVVYHYRLRDDQVRNDEDFFKHAEIVRSIFLAAYPPAWLNGYGPFIADQLKWRVNKRIGVDAIG
jgi:glycosyltransferase involved in cell wall biosynthesis